MKRLAVYAGTFDPPTNGHLDVIRRVQPLFDKVYLVIAENTRKATLFSSQERKDLLEEAVKPLLPAGSIEVRTYSGLIVGFCKEVGARVLIRGLRAVSDFETELQMAAMNRRLDPSIETLHIMTDEKYFFVSSTLVKEIIQFKGSLKDIVPPNVMKSLAERFK